MKLWRWIPWSLLTLMACSQTTIHGITPILPTAELSYWTRIREVKSLQPTFRWEPVTDSTAHYDFIVLESYGSEAVVGRIVYYREGLEEPEHTLEVSLQPDREYYWSVRVRRGEEVSKWSRFDYWALTAYGRSHYEFPFFRFRTPSK